MKESSEVTRLRSCSQAASEVGTRPRSADSTARAPARGCTSLSPVPGQLLAGRRDGGSARPTRRVTTQEVPGWEQHPPILSPAPSPRSLVHTAEGLRWDLLGLGLQWDLLGLRLLPNLPRHSVAEATAASDLEGLEGKVRCGVERPWAKHRCCSPHLQQGPSSPPAVRTREDCKGLPWQGTSLRHFSPDTAEHAVQELARTRGGFASISAAARLLLSP